MSLFEVVDLIFRVVSLAHYNAFKNGFEATGIHLSNTTHAGRTSAARSATMYNATESDTKAHGGWRDGSSFRSCYNRNLPISAMTALAGFDGRQPESYWIPRAEIGQFALLSFSQNRRSNVIVSFRFFPFAPFDICFFHLGECTAYSLI